MVEGLWKRPGGGGGFILSAYWKLLACTVTIRMLGVHDVYVGCAEAAGRCSGGPARCRFGLRAIYARKKSFVQIYAADATRRMTGKACRSRPTAPSERLTPYEMVSGFVRDYINSLVTI